MGARRTRTYEFVNNHRFRRFDETYSQPAIEARMREVLDEFRPDIVQRVLARSPDVYAEPDAKQTGMSRFQPNAVTISRDPA